MLRNLALASITALIAMTASVQAMDTADFAGRAGFMIGAARYCGVSPTRAAHVRQWIAATLVAAASLVRWSIGLTAQCSQLRLRRRRVHNPMRRHHARLCNP
jgi:hypothetical protein